MKLTPVHFLAVALIVAVWQRDRLKEGVATVAETVKNMTIPRGIRNNNPGNLKNVGIAWRGLVGSDGPFCVFDTPENGIRALIMDLRKDYEKDGQRTIRALITEFAPGAENNTAAYIAAVAKRTGYAADAVLPFTFDTFARLSNAIIWHENGRNPYSAEVIASAVQAGGFAYYA